MHLALLHFISLLPMTIPRQVNTMINHKQIAAFSLFILLMGYFSPVVASEKPIAPMLYVERCSFKFEGNKVLVVEMQENENFKILTER